MPALEGLNSDIPRHRPHVGARDVPPLVVLMAMVIREQPIRFAADVVGV